MLKIELDPETIRELARPIAAELLAQLRESEAKMGGDRQLWPEQEAARLFFGWRGHVLRDLRQRGEIAFVKGPGGRIFYDRQGILDYLAKHRTPATGKAVR